MLVNRNPLDESVPDRTIFGWDYILIVYISDFPMWEIGFVIGEIGEIFVPCW